MNRDVEDFHKSKQEDYIKELFQCIKHDTEKSYLFGDEGTTESDVWLPKSQVEVRKLSNGYEVKIPVWLAKKNGLY